MWLTPSRHSWSWFFEIFLFPLSIACACVDREGCGGGWDLTLCFILFLFLCFLRFFFLFFFVFFPQRSLLWPLRCKAFPWRFSRFLSSNRAHPWPPRSPVRPLSPPYRGPLRYRSSGYSWPWGYTIQPGRPDGFHPRKIWGWGRGRVPRPCSCFSSCTRSSSILW